MTLLTDAPAGLLGNQRPRLWSAPEFTSTAADEVIDLAAMAGLYLDDWQQFTLRHSLGERPEWTCSECIYRTPNVGDPCPAHPTAQMVHPWSAPTVVVLVSRQNGKNAITEARELGGLFVFGERRIIHTAHLQDTASVQFERLLSRIDDTPELKKRMLKPVRGKGSEAIVLRTGQRIEFKTRTSKSKRGDSIDCIIFDEAYELPDTAVSAIVPTKSARPNTQIWYTSSAVDKQKHENGMALTRQRERGMAKKPNIAYFEWSVEGDDPSKVPDEIASDPHRWAQANPAFGIRLSHDAVQGECDGDMGRREFAVERLGIGDWPTPESTAPKEISVAAWAALTDQESAMASSAGVLAFDIAPDMSWSSIAGAGRRDDGKIHVGLIDHEERVSWVAKRLIELAAILRPALIVCDSTGQALTVLPELQRNNIDVKVTTAKEYAQACSMFAEAVRDQQVAHIGEPDMLTAIDGATTKPLADAWKWNRRGSDVADISPLVAATLAHWGIVAGATPAPQVWDLNEIVARMRQEMAASGPQPAPGTPGAPETPAPPAAPPKPGEVKFIPLSEMPPRH